MGTAAASRGLHYPRYLAPPPRALARFCVLHVFDARRARCSGAAVHITGLLEHVCLMRLGDERGGFSAAEATCWLCATRTHAEPQKRERVCVRNVIIINRLVILRVEQILKLDAHPVCAVDLPSMLILIHDVGVNV